MPTTKALRVFIAIEPSVIISKAEIQPDRGNVSKMAAPQSVLELIERFDQNRNAYRSDQYNEARLRIEFLNPFFEALSIINMDTQRRTKTLFTRMPSK